MATEPAPFRVFYSYSHADVRMLEKLRKHMAMLRRQGLITEWYDREIEAGSEWRQEIERELEAADVILLLVSADFLASDFCYEQEMTRAVERARRGEALVIGVMLRPVDGWDGTPFAGFQVVPRHARPITKWSDIDEAYTDVVERIRAALEDRSHSAVAAHTLRPDGVSQPADPLAKFSDPATPDEEIFSELELEMLAKIRDPEQRRKQRDEMVIQKYQMLRNPLGNLAQMRARMLEAVERREAEATDPATPGS